MDLNDPYTRGFREGQREERRWLHREWEGFKERKVTPYVNSRSPFLEKMMIEFVDQLLNASQ